MGTFLLGLSVNWTYADNEALVIVGGEGAETVEVATLDGSVSNCDTLTPPKNPHINGHKVFLVGGKLVLCGGSFEDEDGNNERTNECLEFDPASNSWNGFDGGDMDAAEAEFGGTTLDNGESIMVAGGHSP